MPRRVFIFLKKTENSVSYLPHRQLRKVSDNEFRHMISYLPHRQLRNIDAHIFTRYNRYLPHRQLRKFISN